MTQNSEEVQTDLLLMTNNSAQRIPSEEPQSISNTNKNTGISVISVINHSTQQDDIPINAQTSMTERIKPVQKQWMILL